MSEEMTQEDYQEYLDGYLAGRAPVFRDLREDIENEFEDDEDEICDCGSHMHLCEAITEVAQSETENDILIYRCRCGWTKEIKCYGGFYVK
jgi:hypothetical protein